MLVAEALVVGQRLAGISATLRPGEITAICGPNGAGKSTLLACMAGLLAPDSGSIALDGVPLSRLAPRKRARAIGFLPQTPEVAWDVTVETLVALGRLPWQGAPMSRAAASAEDDTAAVNLAIETMDLGVLRCRVVTTLSGGERARALVARVLAGNPRWLLADEPLANLDLGHQLALLGMLRKLAREQGLGVVLVLHDLAQAMNYADRVLVLADGRVLADGPPQAALSEQIIAAGWRVKTRWLGEPGAMALATAG
jgi:iron complex transport system ATP-binding protein